MDFDFSAEEQEWRAEIRAFFSSELPDEFAGNFDEGSDRQWEFSRSFTKRLAERGWLAVGWPEEYGGMGAGHMKQMVFNEEVGYNRAPDPGGIGIRFIGPALMILGTDEQKRKYLPGIIAGDDVWCQGFSEPGAGSDLASLQTRAVADGDHFVVNGSKIWTSHAHRANYAYLAVRTDPDAPKHRGISLMILDMETPGVSLRPLIDMGGHHPFNETFLEDVRIPRENVIGEVDRGWYAMATTLDFERSGIRGVASTRRSLEQLVSVLQETQAEGTRVVLNVTRHALAARVVENEVNRLMAYLVVSMQARGMVPNHQASTTKLFGADLAQRLSNTAINMYGLYGQLRPGSAWTIDRGGASQHYLGSVSASIAGGTNEVQRNVIATRGLGLPRG